MPIEPTMRHPGRRQFLLGGAALGFAGGLAACASKAPKVLALSGLQAPVEIIEDRWGVPHVRAASIPDAYFMDGYLAARDRLWDLDFGHRRALGHLAAVFGPAFVASDTANRLVLFAGDAARELDACTPVVRDCARAYVAGINARIAEVVADPALLPVEFTALDYRPMAWDVLDLIRMRAEIVGNTRGEIRRAMLAARGALASDALVTPLEPAHTPMIPDGLDVHAITTKDLGWFDVLQAPLPMHDIAISGDPSGDFAHRRQNAGSNSWVVAPGRTASGRPILANDPHLSFGVPGPRRVVHLKAPGLDVIGGGTPGMPGVMQGHNDHIAFGRTNFHIDQEDLFILQTDPDDPDVYFHDGIWKRMTSVAIDIAVRDAPNARAVLRYAAQGPVVSQDRGRAVAVSATWLYPGANGLLANVAINLATDWNSFKQALRGHTSPTNFTYADTAGNIGWHAAGGLPHRADGHDGLLPAPGDGRFDWHGLRPLDDLPSIFNPSQGFFGTSNEMNLPAGYPVEAMRVSFEWRDRFRHERVVHVLGSQRKATLQDSVALQHDTHSALALRTTRLLPHASAKDLAPYVALLRQWDGNVAADSAAAALYEVWSCHLERALYEILMPPQVRDLLPGPLNATVQIEALERPDARFGGSPKAARDQSLLTALRAAIGELQGRCGVDPETWAWGALHAITLGHPLARIAPIGAAFPPIGGAQTRSGGDAYTVMARWYNPLAKAERRYATTGGASYLMVCDVGAWDNSLYLNFPGQSGEPSSPHYADLLDVWMRGAMQTLAFSDTAVEARAVRRVQLAPGAHA